MAGAYLLAERAMAKNDEGRLRKALERDRSIAQGSDGSSLARRAFKKGAGDLVKVLVEYGLSLKSAVYVAASAGDAEIVRWACERGAPLNSEYEGEPRCDALVRAAHSGNLEVAKVLVEFEANVNAEHGELTPVMYARMYGSWEVEDFLRSQGALTWWELKGLEPPFEVRTLTQHLPEYFGEPEEFVAATGDPPIGLLRVLGPGPDRTLLVTHGSAGRSLEVPPDAGNYRFVELAMFVRRDRPAEERWAGETLLAVARRLHDERTWLGRDVKLLPFGERFPNSPMRTLLALAAEESRLEGLDTGAFHYEDAESHTVQIWTLLPVHDDEAAWIEEDPSEALWTITEATDLMTDLGRVCRTSDP